MKSLTIQTEVTKADLNKAMLNYEQRLMENTQILEMQRHVKSSQSIGRWLEWLVKIIIIGLMLLQIIVCVVGIIYQPYSFVFFLCVLLVTTLLVGIFFWAERKWGKKVNGKLLLRTDFLSRFSFLTKKNASRFRQSTFRNFDNQPLPFTAIYEFKGNKLTYYRAFENQKKLILNKMIKAKKYDVFDGVVILYPSTWLAFPRLTLFITAENLPILLDYLHKLGQSPLEKRMKINLTLAKTSKCK